MKKTLFLLFMLCAAEVSFAQATELSKSPEDEKIYSSVEENPQFVGGIKEFYNFVGKTFRVPEVEGLSGKIIVVFTVEKDGSLSDIKVSKDLGHGTAEEAVRVLSKSPKWIPGKQKGVPVRTLYSLPISINSY